MNVPLQAFSALHTTASRNLYALLENNRSYPSSFVGVGHEPRVIFSHSKDEAWSQHEHLHDCDNFKNISIDYGVRSITADDRKESNKGKTRVELEWEKVLNYIQFITLPCEVKYMSLH